MGVTGTRSIRLTALGQTIEVVFGDEITPDHVAQLTEVWRDALGSDADADAVVVVGESPRLGNARIVAGDLSKVASDLSASVTQVAIEAAKGTGLLMHAAGLASDDGRTVVFVAPSGGGKTTISSRLGKRYGYVSDETVLICPSLAVRSYRKPLSIVVDEGKVKSQVAPTELGLLQLPAERLRLGGLIILDRRSDAPVVPELEQVPLVDAMLAILPQLSFGSQSVRTLPDLAEAVLAVGGAVRLSYRDDADLSSIVPRVLELAPLDAAWAWDEPRRHRRLAAGEWARSAGAVALRADGRVLVQVADSVLELGGVSPMLWDALAGEPLSHDELARLVEATVGPAPEGSAADALMPALVRLADEGVLATGAAD